MTHILLIDDDEAIRDSSELLLTASGFSVSTACDGREGLQLYAAQKPDLVITDILMPGMEGVETILQLRRIDAVVPILAVSGGWSGKYRQSVNSPLDLAMKLGATKALVKPFEDDDLLTAISDCVSGVAQISDRPIVPLGERNAAGLADTDPLTGLPNRHLLLDRLALACESTQGTADSFAVLLVDIDHFRDINDTLGHHAGDALLREVARRLSQFASETYLIARLGADEFAVVQMDTAGRADPAALAVKITAGLAEPFFIEGHNLHLNASIGIAVSTAEVTTPDALLRRADVALGRAKSDGRNCYRFHAAELDHKVTDRVVLAEDLRLGIDRGELELYYQPQVDLESGRTIGLEALVRWNHPARGLVMPLAFVPIAERTGSIVALGRWVIDEACRQIQSWKDQQLTSPVVALNVSALQTRTGSDLVGDLTGSMARWGVDAAELEIELTESVLMETVEGGGDILEQLCQLGFRLAIDDFGSGYSPLTYLTAYSVTRLKIAQELVRPAVVEPRCATVVRSAINLASALGIEALAEGVETEAHVRLLRSAGCRQAQGYHFSRPLSAALATEMLTRECRPTGIGRIAAG